MKADRGLVGRPVWLVPADRHYVLMKKIVNVSKLQYVLAKVICLIIVNIWNRFVCVWRVCLE